MVNDRSLGEVGRDAARLEQAVKDKVDKGVYESDQKANDARHTRTERDIDRVYERIRTVFWVGGGGLAATMLADVIKAVRGDG